MKKRHFAGWLLCAAMTLFASCSNDDDVTSGNAKVPTVVSDNFKTQFPKAVNVNWTEKRGYLVADFDLSKAATRDSKDRLCEAWYTMDGHCSLYEQDLTLVQLKADFALVWEAYQQTAYAAENYSIDDIDFLRRNLNSAGEGEESVKMEVEKGEKEFDLYFSIQGVLLKEVADTDDDDDDDDNLPCPTALSDYVAKYYADATIVNFEEEFDKETNAKVYEVEILRYFNINGKKMRVEFELTFDTQYKLLRSRLDFDDNEEKAFLRFCAGLLSDTDLTKWKELTGEADPGLWDVEVVETDDHKIAVYLEIETAGDKDEFVLILELSLPNVGL